MSDWSEYTSTDFGKGKENTTKMIARWKLGDVSNGGYGKQDNCASHKDIWGQIQAQVNEGWYIPSRGELSAFAKAFEITTSNYSSQYKLSNYYWSSSQFGGYRGWISNFIGELMYYDTVRTYHFVRLTATF
jgi:hypothetical protein